MPTAARGFFFARGLRFTSFVTPMHRLFSIVLLSLPLWCSAADTNLPSYKELATLEFPALKVALEKAGWPTEHIQAFVGIEIQRRLNPPDIAKASDFRPFEFWRTGPDAEPLSVINTPQHLAERARHEEDARTQFSTLFPPSEPEENKLLLAWNEQRQWGNLPTKKHQAVTTLLSRAEKERDALMHSRGGILSAGEHRQLWKLAEDTRAELAHLLTPEELLDYDLKNSSTANLMRSELDSFQPTQTEFLAIFKLRHPLELNFGHKNIGTDPEVDRQRTETEEQIQKSISQLLGPERYDDYHISLQPACQTLQFDGRYARTDAATVRRLYRSLLSAQMRIRKLESLPEAEKTPAQAKIKDELYREFRLVLDEEGTRRYLQEQSLWP
jgi:hypothetical protein